MTQEIRRLYRSRSEARLAGVCGGLAGYLKVDPVFVRLVWVVVTCFTGFVPGLVAYLLAWAIVPPEPLPVKVAEPVREPNAGPA